MGRKAESHEGWVNLDFLGRDRQTEMATGRHTERHRDRNRYIERQTEIEGRSWRRRGRIERCFTNQKS